MTLNRGDQPSAEVRAALDEMPCGLLRVDAEGRILRANATFCRWTGYSLEQLLGRRFQDLLTMGGRIFHQTHWLPLLHMQGSVSEVKLDLVTSGALTVPVMVNARRHRIGGGMVDDIALFVARDRDKYERELLQSRKRLEQSVAETKAAHAAAEDRALLAEQMMGIVSHDLRNSLQTIQMGTTVLSRGQATAHQLTLLGRVSRAADRARRLIADLLDFTSARLGRGIAIQPRTVQVHAALADLVDELRDALPGRELLHVTQGPGECTVDPDRLAQVVGNLVGNAAAYGDPARPITVTSALTDGTLLVSVHNHGTPIAAADQARLFRPFVRGTDAVGTQRSVGLGLFIVQEIARAHRGEVAVASGAAEGTTFTLRLPAAGPAAAPA